MNFRTIDLPRLALQNFPDAPGYGNSNIFAISAALVLASSCFSKVSESQDRLLVVPTMHSGHLCSTCESKAMRRQLHDHSHVFFVVTLHQFSECCYFSSQKHGFPFIARDVVLLLSFAIATCALARARSKVLQEVLMCALARARSKVSQCCSNMSQRQILEFRFLDGNYRHYSHVVVMIAQHRDDHE